MASRVFGCRPVRAAGIESEIGLAYAALHQPRTAVGSLRPSPSNHSATDLKVISPTGR